MSTVRLAVVGGAQGERNGALLNNYRDPALLVSYVYLKAFRKAAHLYHYRDWVLDSGAFSAHNSGQVINLQEFIDCAKENLANDPKLTEVFGLDVIGDHEASLRNVEEMWRQGVPAIPTWHPGEPWEALVHMAKTYPKIAVGGLVRVVGKERRRLLDQIFARVWPKKIHGFGIGAESFVMRYPFHSVDASNWEMRPVAWGIWSAYGASALKIRGSNQNLRAEVEHFLRLEERARDRWQKEMALLNATDAPTVRLAAVSNRNNGIAATRRPER